MADKAPRASEVALQQARAFGLTTVRLLAHTRFGGDRHAARQVLGRLTQEGKLFRHLCRYSGSEDCFAYHSLAERPLRLLALRGAYGVACHFLMRPVPLAPISEADYLAATNPVASALGVAPPPLRMAFLAPAQDGNQTLNVVVPLRLMPLGKVMTKLQDWATSEEFVVWNAFLQGQKVSFTLLIAGRARAAELGLWLKRRPVVIRSRSKALAVPFAVETLRPLR